MCCPAIACPCLTWVAFAKVKQLLEGLFLSMIHSSSEVGSQDAISSVLEGLSTASIHINFIFIRCPLVFLFHSYGAFIATTGETRYYLRENSP